MRKAETVMKKGNSVKRNQPIEYFMIEKRFSKLTSIKKRISLVKLLMKKLNKMTKRKT